MRKSEDMGAHVAKLESSLDELENAIGKLNMRKKELKTTIGKVTEEIDTIRKEVKGESNYTIKYKETMTLNDEYGRVDKDKGASAEADDDGYIEVKNKKLEMSPKTAPYTGKKKVSTTVNSLKKTDKTNVSTSGNGTFSLSNSFEALNVDNPVIEEINSGNKTLMSGVQEEGQIFTLLVEKINMGDHDSEDEVEHVDNEMASYMALKPSWVSYGTNSLLGQWRETYENANYNYDPYDEDMYEDQEIADNIQSICDNFDVKARGRNKNRLLDVLSLL
nr:structural maintenance of chromosomes protein 1 [Tanacetum cinerariifolium]